jgi:hypothetical protein
MRKSLTVHGIYVGSRTMFEAMDRAITAAGLRPVIDRRFAFDDARAALKARFRIHDRPGAQALMSHTAQLARHRLRAGGGDGT